MTERFAIYYAPAPASLLSERAAQWLDDRDAAAAIPGLDSAERLQFTRSARRYGFHATIKAPMALAAGRTCAELQTALAAFAMVSPAVSVGRLTLADLDGFLALVPRRQSPALTEFAAACVAAFEPFRAPLAADDRARRIAGGLSAHQIGLLDRYGYPYAMDQFRFHMTLTDRLPPAEAPTVTAAARDWFAAVLGDHIVLDRLALFHEPEPSAAFRRVADFPLVTRVTL